MTAEHAYGEALTTMDETAAVGLKAAVEALRDGNDETAVELLRTTADILE